MSLRFEILKELPVIIIVITLHKFGIEIESIEHFIFV